MSDKGRIAQLTARLDRVGEIKEAAGVYAETKVQELAERKLRVPAILCHAQGFIAPTGRIIAFMSPALFTPEKECYSVLIL